jgi:hypothetical protein
MKLCRSALLVPSEAQRIENVFLFLLANAIQLPATMLHQNPQNLTVYLLAGVSFTAPAVVGTRLFFGRLSPAALHFRFGFLHT